MTDLRHLTGTNPQANLVELCQKLRKEKLYSNSELELVNSLVAQVNERVIALFQELWQTWHLQLNILDLEINKPTQFADGTQSASVTPQAAQFRSRRLVDGLSFIPAKSHFSDKAYVKKFSTFLHDLRSRPNLLAACLNYGNVLGIENARSVVHTVIVTLYGNNIASNNHHDVLELLQCLALLVLTQPNQGDIKRSFMKSTCTFIQAFRLFVDIMPKTKLFVTTAFHDTIIEVLTLEPILLDVDPNTIIDRMAPDERIRRFGTGPDAKQKIHDYVQKCSDSLLVICRRLIANIRRAVVSFPPAIAWVLNRVYTCSQQFADVNADEAFGICYELLVSNVLYPALVNPEKYGICPDHVQVTQVHRHNLMKIGQILSGLRHVRTQSSSPSAGAANKSYHEWIYTQLPGDSIRNVVSDIINKAPTDKECDTASSSVTMAPTVNSILIRYTSKLFLITPMQLAQITEYLHRIRESNVQGVDQNCLQGILNQLPADPLTVCLSGNSSGIRDIAPTSNGFQTLPRSASSLSSAHTRSFHNTSGDGTTSPGTLNRSGNNALDELKHNMSREFEDLRADARKNFKELGTSVENTARIMFKKVRDGPVSPSMTPPRSPVSEMTAERVAEISEEKVTQEVVLTFRAGSEMLPPNASCALDLKIMSEFETIELEKKRLSEEKQHKLNMLNRRRGLRPHTPGSAIVTTAAPAAGFNIQHSQAESAMAARSSQVSVTSSHQYEDNKTQKSLRFSLYSDGISHVSEKKTEHENYEDEVIANAEQRLTENDTNAAQAGNVSSCIHDSNMGGSQLSVNADDDASSTESDTKNRADFGPPMTHEASGPDPLERMEDADDLEKSIMAEKKRSGSSVGSDNEDDDDEDGQGSIPQRKTSSQDAQALQRLERNVGTSRETIEQRMRRFPNDQIKTHNRLGVIVDGETHSECWSTDAMAESDQEQGIDYGERTLDGILEEDRGDQGKDGTDRDRRTNKSYTSSRSNSRPTILSNSLQPTSQEHFGDSRSDIWSVEVSPTETDSPPLDDEDVPVSARESIKKRSTKGERDRQAQKSGEPKNPTISARPVIIGGGEPEYTSGVIYKENPSTTSESMHLNRGSFEKIDSDIASPAADKVSSQVSNKNQTSNCSTPATLSSGTSMEKPSFGANNREVLDLFDPLKSMSINTSHPGTTSSSQITISPGHPKVHLPPEVPKRVPVVNASPNMTNSSSFPSLHNAGGDPYRNPSKCTPPSSTAVTVLTSTPSGQNLPITGITKSNLVPECVRRLKEILSTVDAARPASAIAFDGLLGLDSGGPHDSLFTSLGQSVDTMPMHRDVRQQIVTFLYDQLSVALAIHQQDTAVQIQETLRLFEHLTPKHCLRVVKQLWEETSKYSNVYSAYLVSTRQNLLQVLCYFKHLTQYTKRDTSVCVETIIRLCTSAFLSSVDMPTRKWAQKFLKVPDTKQRVESAVGMIEWLKDRLRRTRMFRKESEMATAQTIIERKVYACVYKTALCPNGDVDVARDEKYTEILEILERKMLQGFDFLEIPQKYQVGAPWTPAVIELKMLNAFCTPKDKVRCIGRTCRKIVHLLRLSCPGDEIGADDILPVLIYILIWARPASVLTTIDFIENYYPDITGEESYQFMMFSSAVNHAKTLA